MRTTCWILTGLALLAVLGGAITASAAENIVFIVDASNSMNKLFEGEATRYAAAVQAMSELLVSLPNEVDAGLLMYGWRIDRRNQVASCQDIELIYPIQPLTDAIRSDIGATLAAIVPQGMTPLAASLVRAGEALSGLEGSNAIILLSDGEGNCGGDHAAAAAYLAGLVPSVSLHVIGLDLDPSARETLEMMIGATGGSYQGVHDIGALIDALYAAFGDVSADGMTTESFGIPAEYAHYGITNVIWGTEGNDVIYGTSANDLIYGLAGDDFIIGYAGNDVILGGPGDDLIQGMDGDDLLIGGAGNDTLLAGAGNDTVCGEEGDDSLEGEAGNDCLDGGPGDDQLLGGKGTNSLVRSPGNDLMFEGAVTSQPCADCPGCAPCIEPCGVPAAPACATPVSTCPATPAVSGSGCVSPQVVKSIDEGTDLQLHGFVSDEDCDIVYVEWFVGAGMLDDSRSLDPVFTAPWTRFCDGEDVLVRLLAKDSCGASAEDCFLIHINNVNRPPVAGAGPDICVDEGRSVVLTCEGIDPDGDPVTYLWCIESGKGSFVDPTVLHPTFCAPMTAACDGEDVVVRLTVTDSCGLSASDAMTIHVNNVNRPPVADAGPDISVDEGRSVVLTCEGNDPDGDPVKFFWYIESGKGSFVNANVLHPTFCAPMTTRCDGEDVVVRLTVTDSCGLSVSDTMTIHVNNVNRPPVADAGADICIDEGRSVVLTCAATDPDGDPLTYAWCIESGKGSFVDPTMLHPTFCAPMTTRCDGENVVVRLTVTDSCGLSDSDTMTIHVSNVNRPPVAEAGADICVDEGQSIVLTCTGSDPDGDPVKYFWYIQSGGGSFVNANVLHPTFCAPITGECDGEDVVVCLTVTDSCGLSAFDTMTIHVNNVNRPPRVVADP